MGAEPVESAPPKFDVARRFKARQRIKPHADLPALRVFRNLQGIMIGKIKL